MPTEPFRISEIETGMGARLGICRLPGRSGDLAGDLAEIVRWAPGIVVSMTEASEMQAHGAQDLAARLAVRGIAHAHFPIRDFGAPEQADARWPTLSRQLHAVLDAGSGLLLHCMGGKGRSGMVALRLLTERGLLPEAALAAVRAARPGAVETEAQAQWGGCGLGAAMARNPLSRSPDA